jgi:GNAT superfamily N-acetyltransferase
MDKVTLGEDKTGREWVVFMDITPPDELLPNTIVKFKVCSTDDKHAYKSEGQSELTIHQSAPETAKIEDIVVDLPDRGIGTLLIKYMESWAARRNAKKLYGLVSRGSVEHIDKLKHFYEKNGFSFSLDEKPKKDATFIGKVEKSLSGQENTGGT